MVTSNSQTSRDFATDHRNNNLHDENSVSHSTGMVVPECYKDDVEKSMEKPEIRPPPSENA